MISDRWKLAIDIGGTYLRSELYSDQIIKKERLATASSDLIAVIETYLKHYPQIASVGISFAGQVSDGVILSSPNISVSHKNIKEYFETNYAVKLEIDNDLNCVIRAEAEYHQENYIAAIYVGTGLGAAVIDDAKIIRGSSNQSFELGHIPYKKAPFSCGCGKDNCIELFASGLGLERWIRYNNTIEPTQSIEVDLEQLKIEESEIAVAFEKALLYAVATLITLTNPKVLVLGGGVIEKNPYLLGEIRERLSTEALSVSLHRVQIVPSSLSNAAMDGAKLLANY